MQDFDLFKRRTEQKVDPDTGIVYIRDHYSKLQLENLRPIMSDHSTYFATADSAPSAKSLPSAVESVASVITMVSEHNYDSAQDFPHLSREIRFRLVTRTEDNPTQVNVSLQKWRENLDFVQHYVDAIDKRNVLQLNAYWAPSFLKRHVWEYLQAAGALPAPEPRQLYLPLKVPEVEVIEWGEDGPCEDFEEPVPEYNWSEVFKTVSKTGVIDPRFR